MKNGITFALLLLAIGAEACLCVPRTPKEDYDAADTVFVGKVTALTGKKDERWPIMTASMEVERSWKGLHGIRTQVRDTATDCQVGFKVGVRYLVYVRMAELRDVLERNKWTTQSPMK